MYAAGGSQECVSFCSSVHSQKTALLEGLLHLGHSRVPLGFRGAGFRDQAAMWALPAHSKAPHLFRRAVGERPCFLSRHRTLPGIQQRLLIAGGFSSIKAAYVCVSSVHLVRFYIC